MNGQKIEIILSQPAHGIFHGGTDIKQLHVQENALAMFRLELIGQGQTAACQHAQTDFVKRHRVADAFCELQTLQGVLNIEGYDQAVIGHGGLRFWAMGRNRPSLGLVALCRNPWRMCGRLSRAASRGP